MWPALSERLKTPDLDECQSAELCCFIHMEKAPSLCIVNLYLRWLHAGVLQYFARTIKLHSGSDPMNIEWLLQSTSPTSNLETVAECCYYNIKPVRVWRSGLEVYKNPTCQNYLTNCTEHFEVITNLMHKYLYSYNITILYMFRALLCSSSGGSIVYVHHLVPSLSVTAHTAAHRQWRYQMMYIYNWTSWRWA
jgi:hypothetical protein